MTYDRRTKAGGHQEMSNVDSSVKDSSVSVSVFKYVLIRLLGYIKKHLRSSSVLSLNNKKYI